MTKRNTIVVACMVNIWLYKSAFSTLPSGAANCRRINTASRPPTMKKNSAVAPYMRPSFLWSTVNSHDFQPVVATGRRNAPYVRVGVMAGGAGVSAGIVEPGAGRSMMAMVISYLSVSR